jgi:hypothetical protein
VFDPKEARAQHLLLLVVLDEGGLERGDLILQRDKRAHYVFNGFEAAKDLRHGDLSFIVARPVAMAELVLMVVAADEEPKSCDTKLSVARA